MHAPEAVACIDGLYAQHSLTATPHVSTPLSLCVVHSLCGAPTDPTHTGMPLGLHIRNVLHRSAIYSGADLQLWFGVYGRRWWGLGRLNLSFVNEQWVRPAEAETPRGASVVEGGTYWR